MNELSILEKQINDAYVRLDGIKNDLTPTMLKIEQDKIMGLEQRYQQTQTLLQQQLQTLANEYNQPILDRLQKAVEIVADRKKSIMFWMYPNYYTLRWELTLQQR